VPRAFGIGNGSGNETKTPRFPQIDNQLQISQLHCSRKTPSENTDKERVKQISL